jgi:hypothetical protein
MRFGSYIYVDGYDLQDVAALIKQRLTEIASHFPEIRVIDDRFDRTPDLRPEDLPVWNLGLNFDLGVASTTYVPRLLESVRALSRESGRDFAVGYCDRVSKIDEDIGFIEAGNACEAIVGILESLAENGEPDGRANDGSATAPPSSLT